MLCKSLSLAAAVALLAAGCAAPPQWLTKTADAPTAADAPLSAGDLATIAEKFAEQGHYRKALELCDEALRREPTDEQTTRLDDLVARCERESAPTELPTDDSVHEALAALESAMADALATDAARDSLPAKPLPERDVLTASFTPAAPSLPKSEATLAAANPAAASPAGTVTHAEAVAESGQPAVEWTEACAVASPQSLSSNQSAPTTGTAPTIVPRLPSAAIADAPPEEPAADEWEPLIEPGAKKTAKVQPAVPTAESKPLVQLANRPVFDNASGPNAAPVQTVSTPPGLWSPTITPGAGGGKSVRTRSLGDDEWEPVPGSR